MHVLGHSFTRRTAIVLALGALTAGGAGAGTLHRFTVTQSAGAGSLGATAFLNTSNSGGAVQAQVGPSVLTSYTYPFGLFGVYNGTGAGAGIVGLSTTAYGIVGESSSTSPSILASAQSTGIALEAVTPSKSAADTLFVQQLGTGTGADVFAQSGSAVLARAAGAGAGVTASSESGAGVDGRSYSESAPGLYGHGNGNGVLGTSINSNTAIVGSNSSTGDGVDATSAAGYGLFASDTSTAAPAPTSAPGLYAGAFAQSTSGPGVYGVNGHNTGTPALYGSSTVRSDFFAGVYGYGNDGPGMYAYSSHDFGALVTNSGNAPTLYINGDSASGSDLIDASAGTIQTDPILFRVTTAGNLYVTGSITYGGTMTQSARTRSAGDAVATYSAQQSEATIEDVGTAQLVNGYAAVPIAADFGSTIDPAQRYQVFLTPAGDNRGLYVASRTPAGFIVREAQAGHSTLSFDYRVVARPYGKQTARLPHLNARSLQLKGDAMQTSRIPAAFAGTTRNEPARSAAVFALLEARRDAQQHPAAPNIPANLTFSKH